MPKVGDLVKVIEVWEHDKNPEHKVGDTFVLTGLREYTQPRVRLPSGFVWAFEVPGEYGTVCRLEVIPSAPTAPTHDAVAHPSHYTSHPSGIECIEITKHHNFCVGNVIKYCWRAGLKGSEGASELQDLKKARQYLDFEIARLEKGANSK